MATVGRMEACPRCLTECEVPSQGSYSACVRCRAVLRWTVPLFKSSRSGYVPLMVGCGACDCNLCTEAKEK